MSNLVSWLYDSETKKMGRDGLFCFNQNRDKIRLDKQRQYHKNQKAEKREQPVDWYSDEIFIRVYFG